MNMKDMNRNRFACFKNMNMKEYVVVLVAAVLVVSWMLVGKVVISSGIDDPFLATLAQQLAFVAAVCTYVECAESGVECTLTFAGQVKHILPLAIAEVGFLTLLNYGLYWEYPSTVVMAAPVAFAVQFVISWPFAVGELKCIGYPFFMMLIAGVIASVLALDGRSTACIVGSFACLGVKNALLAKFAASSTFFNNNMQVAYTVFPWAFALSMVGCLVFSGPSAVLDLLQTRQVDRIIFCGWILLSGLCMLFAIVAKDKVPTRRFQLCELALLPIIFLVSWLYFGANNPTLSCGGFVLAVVGACGLIMAQNDGANYTHVDESPEDPREERHVILEKDTLDSDEDVEAATCAQDEDALSFGA